MTSANGKAYNQINSPGLLGMGKTNLAGNSCGGEEASQPDVSGYSATGPIQVSFGTSNGYQPGNLISLGDLVQGNPNALYNAAGNAVTNFTAQALRTSSMGTGQFDDARPPVVEVDQIAGPVEDETPV